MRLIDVQGYRLLRHFKHILRVALSSVTQFDMRPTAIDMRRTKREQKALSTIRNLPRCARKKVRVFGQGRSTIANRTGHSAINRECYNMHLKYVTFFIGDNFIYIFVTCIEFVIFKKFE